MNSDYKVLYRKYRPSNFDEVVGQIHTIQMLKNAVINNKISHAYIFTGPRGTGKTSTAKIFAKTINCENLHEGIPCGECNSCKSIVNNADIIEIDAASNNGVDEIRELINNVKISPSFCKYKVYIIDEVHMMTQSAFNALLLTLEEPPAHVVFILATTNVENVPITILSRCQRYDFKKISDEEIIDHLKKIAKLENINIDDEAIQEISYLSDGGLRDALSILNQLSTSNDIINLNTVLENYGSVSLVQIKKIVEFIIENDYNSLKQIFENLKSNAVDYKNFIKKLIDELFKKGISLKEQYQDKEYTKVKNIVFSLNDLINKININIDPFLLIFMVLVENIKFNLKELDNKEIEEKVVENINFPKKENNDKNADIEEHNVSEEFVEQLIPIRINNCFLKADKKHLIYFKNNWQQFIEKLDSKVTFKSLIVDCDVVLASENINIITHSQQSVVNLFNKDLNNIENEYNKIFALNLKFIAITTEKWNIEKQQYVNKLKEGFKYEYIEEPEIPKLDNSDNLKKEDSSIDDVMEIFDQSKIEIK